MESQLRFLRPNVLRNGLKTIRHQSAAERLSVQSCLGRQLPRTLRSDVLCRSSVAQWSKDFLTVKQSNLSRLRRSRHYVIFLRCLYNRLPLRKTKKTIPKSPNYFQKWVSYEWLSKMRVVFIINFTFLGINVPIISDLRGIHHWKEHCFICKNVISPWVPRGPHIVQ